MAGLSLDKTCLDACRVIIFYRQDHAPCTKLRQRDGDQQVTPGNNIMHACTVEARVDRNTKFCDTAEKQYPAADGSRYQLQLTVNQP